MKKRTIIWIICILIFINLPFWKFFTCRWYTYSNRDGSFIYEEPTGYGGSYTTVLMVYGGFLQKHPEKDKGDNNLYRTFTIQPWRFWEWREMLFTSDRFRLPYKAPSP